MNRLTEAVNATGDWFAIPYGPSGVAPTNDVRAYELYFERLEQAGLGKIKRPDLLIFPSQQRKFVHEILHGLGGETELPFTSEDDTKVKQLLKAAVLAVECENSLWRATRMPDFGSSLTPQKRLGGKPGLKKTAVLPTVIIKEEDRGPLREWQHQHGVPIHIWHVFYDLAFGLTFDRAEELVRDGLILPNEQTFQAPGGATTKKVIYKYYYQYAYQLAVGQGEPKLLPAFVEDKNGHILPYVTFSGGKFNLHADAFRILAEAAARRK